MVTMGLLEILFTNMKLQLHKNRFCMHKTNFHQVTEHFPALSFNICTNLLFQ